MGDDLLARLEKANPGELDAAEALRLLDDVERAATEANARAKELAKAKSRAKTVAIQVYERLDLDVAGTTAADGTKLRYTPYEFKAYQVVDEEAFREWEAAQDESFYDPTPKLREAILRDECRRRVDDGEPLPPGVREYTETRLSRSAVK